MANKKVTNKKYTSDYIDNVWNQYLTEYNKSREKGLIMKAPYHSKMELVTELKVIDNLKMPSKSDQSDKAKRIRTLKKNKIREVVSSQRVVTPRQAKRLQGAVNRFISEGNQFENTQAKKISKIKGTGFSAAAAKDPAVFEIIEKELSRPTKIRYYTKKEGWKEKTYNYYYEWIDSPDSGIQVIE